jgi:hypothetical protein
MRNDIWKMAPQRSALRPQLFPLSPLLLPLTPYLFALCRQNALRAPPFAQMRRPLELATYTLFAQRCEQLLRLRRANSQNGRKNFRINSHECASAVGA